jgi:hypothetical protein
MPLSGGVGARPQESIVELMSKPEVRHGTLEGELGPGLEMGVCGDSGMGVAMNRGEMSSNWGSILYRG